MENVQDKEIITTNEAAELLNVKPSTIHKYVKNGDLKPVYDDYHIDRTKLFFKMDILELKKQKVKPGLTTGEAGKLLGLHTATILQYIQQGLLNAEKKDYKGKSLFFISFEELERFKSVYESMKRSEGKDFYDKEMNFALFQSFIDPNGNTENHLLMNEEGQLYLHTHDGQDIPYNELLSIGYKPLNPIVDIGYKSKKGYAKFLFRESSDFYKMINLFYLYLGPKNMKVILKEDNHIHVEVKPVLIKEDLSSLDYDYLKSTLKEGSVTKRLDGVYIDSDIEVITVSTPSWLKKKIKEDADNHHTTMEDWVLRILEEKYPNKD